MGTNFFDNTKTTIEILKADLPTWHRWCHIKNMFSAELMHEIIRYVQLKKQNEFYNTLTTRDDFKKLLSDCKIDKKRITIEKKGTHLI